MPIFRVVSKGGGVVDVLVSSEFNFAYAARSAKMDGYILAPQACIPWDAIDIMFLLTDAEAAAIKPRDNKGNTMEGNAIGVATPPKANQN